MRNNASGVLKERFTELDDVRVGHGAAVAFYGAGIAGDIVRRALRFRWCYGRSDEHGMFIRAQRGSVARQLFGEAHIGKPTGLELGLDLITVNATLLLREAHRRG